MHAHQTYEPSLIYHHGVFVLLLRGPFHFFRLFHIIVLCSASPGPTSAHLIKSQNHQDVLCCLAAEYPPPSIFTSLIPNVSQLNTSNACHHLTWRAVQLLRSCNNQIHLYPRRVCEIFCAQVHIANWRPILLPRSDMKLPQCAAPSEFVTLISSLASQVLTSLTIDAISQATSILFIYFGT